MTMLKNALAAALALACAAAVSAAPLLQDAAQALAPMPAGPALRANGSQLLLAGLVQPLGDLDGSLGLLPAADPAGSTRPPAPVAADTGGWPVLDGIGADLWAQMAALATAGSAALGLLLLKRGTAQRHAAALATPARPAPKRRRVAYRL